MSPSVLEQIPALFLHPIQAHQLLGDSNDAYEREAEQVSQHIIRQLERPAIASEDYCPRSSPVTSYADTEGVTGVEQAASHQHSRTIQRLPCQSDPTGLLSVLRHAQGHPLPVPIRQSMEDSFGGEDFKHIRYHDDRPSRDLAHSLGAESFTFGEHIVGDIHNPEVLAHELQHERQQRKQTPKQTSSDRPSLPVSRVGQPQVQRMLTHQGRVLSNEEIIAAILRFQLSEVESTVIMGYASQPALYDFEQVRLSATLGLQAAPIQLHGVVVPAMIPYRAFPYAHPGSGLLPAGVGVGMLSTIPQFPTAVIPSIPTVNPQPKELRPLSPQKMQACLSTLVELLQSSASQEEKKSQCEEMLSAIPTQQRAALAETLYYEYRLNLNYYLSYEIRSYDFVDRESKKAEQYVKGINRAIAIDGLKIESLQTVDLNQLIDAENLDERIEFAAKRHRDFVDENGAVQDLKDVGPISVQSHSLLGVGYQGKVKATQAGVVKIQKVDSFDPFVSLGRELAALACLQAYSPDELQKYYPQVIAVRSTFNQQQKKRIYVEMSKIEGKTLDKVQIPNDFNALRRFLTTLFLGFANMHRLGITHGDIQSGNIMVHPSTYEASIIDFGQAILFPEKMNSKQWDILKLSDTLTELLQDPHFSRTMRSLLSDCIYLLDQSMTLEEFISTSFFREVIMP